MRVRRLIKTAIAVALALSAAGAAQPRGGGGDPRTLGGQLKPTTSQYYTIYTDVTGDDVKEAVIRMTKMAEEYNERTRKLFKGRIGSRLPFYLYAKSDDYYKAGGMKGSAGVFNGECLMAMVMPTKDGRVGPATWHVVQHEGFHQFVKSVIGGEIPIWVNEGLAEYFGEGMFTGDGMVTGLIPASRLERVKARFGANGFPSIKQMMALSHAEWNAAFEDHNKAGANYDMAWTMVHFLAHAEGGKYQDPFANFLVQTGKGRPWEQAWNSSFGSVEGFEEKWKAYWTGLPDNPTADLYAKAVVSTFTGYLGRAATQKQTFTSFDEFVGTDPKKLKNDPADWLPPTLFTDMKTLATSLQSQGGAFTVTQAKGAPPTIACTMPDGSKLVGTCTLSGPRIGKVSVAVTKAPVTKAAAPKPPSPALKTAKP
jgi:hypothetical protein